MKPENIYQELKDLAEKLEVTVSEQNFRTSGIKIKSGLCKVKGKNLFVMDKHKSLKKKIEILASQLAAIPHEDVFIVPAIRELLDVYRKNPEAS
jgi:ABC-type enterochelin transport system substrate-binding protein